MQDVGKVLVMVGLVVAVAGAWLWSGLAGPVAGRYFVSKRRFSFLFPGHDLHFGQHDPDFAGPVFSALTPLPDKK
jgi:hypothetical protein